MAVRATMVPVNLNASALSTNGGIFPTAPSGGIDAAGAGGSTFGTTWASGPYGGVQFINNGNMFLWYYNPAAEAITGYALVGQKAGNQVQPYTTYSYTIPATAQYGWLGPWSVQQFTQTDGAQFATGIGNGGSAPGGEINASTPSGVGYTCVDFTGTLTNFALRLYQLIPAIP